MNKQTFFISGIDTDIGKSYATGYIARTMMDKGKRVITQKFIQTGNTGISEDIRVHRKLMGLEVLPEDLDGTTCPIIMRYPASPHLAAKIDQRIVDLSQVRQSTEKLHANFDIVLIEGAGGIMVPATEQVLTIDYIQEQALPVILVTSPRLGSINHTLLTLDACKVRNIPLYMLAYNEFDIEDHIITEDTKAFLQNYIAIHFPATQWINIPALALFL